MSQLVNRVVLLAQELAIDPDNIEMMSTGEGVAAALLNDRLDLLPSQFHHPLDAFERLDEAWINAVLKAHRIGWR